MYEHIPDYREQFLDFQARQEAELERLPKCEECGDVLEDYCYEVDGKYLCKDCFDDAFRIYIDSDDIICDSCEKPIDDDTAYHIDGVYLCEEHANFAYRISTPEYDD